MTSSSIRPFSYFYRICDKAKEADLQYQDWKMGVVNAATIEDAREALRFTFTGPGGAYAYHSSQWILVIESEVHVNLTTGSY